MSNCERRGALGFAWVVTILLVPASGGEVLYNGIRLPDVWPPRPATFARHEPITPPYLLDPPDVIPIDVGRQLFVDDFLVESTTLEREFHQPEWSSDTPILEPERPWELHNGQPFAAPFSDGVWWDPRERLFKMWYMGGNAVFFCYATSRDGVHWERPDLDEFRKDTNILRIEPIQRDSSTVWLDLDDPNPDRRFKLAYWRAGLHTRFSSDGIRWSQIVDSTRASGDRTTIFRNPFRNVWVYGIRTSRRDVGRCRYYGEAREFGRFDWQNVDDLSRWACADDLDRVRREPFEGDLPDLYNLDATPYESLMLGLFTIHSRVAEGPRPKLNHVTLGFSRDGFHWSRPDRRPFLNVSEDPAAWNFGNVQSTGGGCLVMGDRLYFYCSGRNSGKPQDDGSGGRTGLAFLRRDGFASLVGGEEAGTVTTRPLQFTGGHLFVNAATPDGELRVEVLDEAGRVIAPFSRANCRPISADATLQPVAWEGAADVAALAGRAVRLRFHLRNGRLFSFWVSPDASGASHGYVAAGGTGFTGHRDTVGRGAYEAIRAAERDDQ
jgi:hypothetical protein